MKKWIILSFTFLLSLLLFSNKVSAKSDTRSDITISFGDEDVLNMRYTTISSYKILSDKSFYYNGDKYQLNEDYSLVNSELQVDADSTFTLNGETLKIDSENNIIIGSKSHETYSLSVNVELKNSSKYLFKQTLCYKYKIGETVKEACNMDEGDNQEISASLALAYHYDFLPFYSEDIVFDYLTYKFSLENELEIITFSDITFNKDEINYKDYFTISSYGPNYNSIYNEKNYVIPAYDSIVNKLVIDALYYPGYATVETRTYTVTFSICVGEDYLNCKEVYSSEVQRSNVGRVYSIPLSNIEYDLSTRSVNYSSFKLKGTYVCNSNTSDPRAQKEVTSTNETIYYLNLKAPTLKENLKGISLDGCGYVDACYGVSQSVSNIIEFEDDNGLISIDYLITDKIISDASLINTSFVNGSEVSLDKEEGLYYLYFKILDGSGTITYYIYGYLFDFTAPTMNNNNFENYDENKYYNEVNIQVNYLDNKFSNSSNIIYYQIVEFGLEVTKESIIESDNVYSGVLKLEELVSDGSYKVCFIGSDPLNNYSAISCSNKINLDITELTKEEVTITGYKEGYQKSFNLNIKIDNLEDEVSFKCGLVLSSILINSETELTSTCLNNKDNILTVNDENVYSLWIYAHDKANNYSLIKFDESYFIDNLAPRVTYQIEGNNMVYSNNVKLRVNVNDLNDIDVSDLSYSFYLSTYKESDFVTFNLENGISYPFDYYGNYKLAIKACDVVNNCKINTYQDIFYIDTGKVNLVLKGKEKVTILKWGTYKEEGASASKGNNGKYPTSLEYKIEGTVDTNKVGTYYLTYTSGEGMNRVSVVREVEVVDSFPLIVSLVSLLLVGETIILLRIFIKRKKNDSI